MQAVTVSAAARLCGVDRRTLQRAIQAGRLPLDAQHCLSREVLIAAGYLDAMPPQDTPHGTSQYTPYLMPQDTSQDTPQDTSQELVQATALLALLERLTTAITDLHEEVRSLREDLRQRSWRTPQERRRGASTAPRAMPQSTPQDTPQVTPQPTPQLLGTYDPRAAAARMQTLRHQGLSLTQIAAQLTAEGVPTRYGLPWQHSPVRHLLKTYGK
jgi:hypothetical protein